MRARSEPAGIGKIEVLSNEKAAFTLCGFPDFKIARTQKALVVGSVNVVSERSKPGCKTARKILVQLDLHPM